MSTEHHAGPGAKPRGPASRRVSRRQALTSQLAGYPSGPDAPLRATQSALARADDASSIVLVEGISDQIAVETLAERLGRRLEDEQIVILPIGGAHAAKQFIARFSRTEVRLSGLCDRAESGNFASALADDGRGRSPEVLENNGFYVCDSDLEDELIRSIDVLDIESILARNGDLRAFRTFQKQPEWRDKSFHQQMHRWLGSVARRKSRYAKLLVIGSKSDRIPGPLLSLVKHI